MAEGRSRRARKPTVKSDYVYFRDDDEREQPALDEYVDLKESSKKRGQTGTQGSTGGETSKHASPGW